MTRKPDAWLAKDGQGKVPPGRAAWWQAAGHFLINLKEYHRR
jgi:hypothetical protein